jgi:hypothetical protein
MRGCWHERANGQAWTTSLNSQKHKTKKKCSEIRRWSLCTKSDWHGELKQRNEKHADKRGERHGHEATSRHLQTFDEEQKRQQISLYHKCSLQSIKPEHEAVSNESRL